MIRTFIGPHFLCVAGLLLFLTPSYIHAQDTLRVSLQDFLNQGIEASSLLDAEQQNVDLAENQYARARGARILPEIGLTTAHGLVPGVVTNRPEEFSRGELYLDPYLENDWEDWGIFTQGEISAIQPIFTWGAINNAINAAQAGADASHHEFDVERSDYELQLFELYYGRILAIEMERLVDEASEQLSQAEELMQEMLEDNDPNLNEADVYQFNIFRYEFASQAEEVRQNVNFVEEAWRLALKVNEQTMLYPQEPYLDPLVNDIQEIDYYMGQAMNNRPDLKGLDAAVRAADYGVEATRSQFRPGLFLGLNGRFAHTPNRPRQTNPFIRNNTNYSSGSFGVGIRQNLNISGMRKEAQRSEAQLRQVKYYKEAAVDGISLELNEQYSNVKTAEARVNNTRGALNVSNEWLRQEQLDFDLGFGDVENLVDAVRSNLELEVTFRQHIHDYNVSLARLFNMAGLPLRELN
ncbi:MAG: TolC family protein [Balneolales bacterium]